MLLEKAAPYLKIIKRRTAFVYKESVKIGESVILLSPLRQQLPQNRRPAQES